MWKLNDFLLISCLFTVYNYGLFFIISICNYIIHKCMFFLITPRILTYFCEYWKHPWSLLILKFSLDLNFQRRENWRFPVGQKKQQQKVSLFRAMYVNLLSWLTVSAWTSGFWNCVDQIKVRKMLFLGEY